MENLYSFSEWIYRLFKLHILWLLFSIGGLIIFGFFPSTTALLSTIREMKLNPHGTPIFRTFFHYYKTTFLKSNILALWYVLISVLIYIYLQFISTTQGSSLAVTHLLIYGIILFLSLFSVFLLPFFAYFEMNFIDLFKQCFKVISTNWKYNSLTVLMLIIYFQLIIKFSVILILFGITIPAYFITTFALMAIEDFEQKQELNKLY